MLVMGTLTLAAAALAWALATLPRHFPPQPYSRRIEFGNHVSRLDDLIFLDIDLENLAADARADLDQMAVDLRVIGVFAISGAPPNAQSNQREHHDHDYDDALRRGFGCAPAL